MCYSNSSTSTNEQLAKTYRRKVSSYTPEIPLFYASGFSFPTWRIITASPELETMGWGLLPWWFQGNDPLDFRQKTLNARVESIYEKKSYQGLVKAKRCIIPSDGFFEWQHNGKNKTPYFIYPKNTPMFSMAGLYDEWTNPEGTQSIKTFSILTTTANTLLGEIHNQKKRMPLLIDPSHVDAYVEGSDVIEAFPLLEEQYMTAHPVKKSILLSALSNIPEAQQPYVENIGIQNSLFS